MVASEIEQLAETIKECIAIRGIYLLMDERLDLICGPETLENIDSPQVTQKMAEFAARYGVSITRYQGGFDRRQENPVNLSTLNLKPRKKS